MVPQKSNTIPKTSRFDAKNHTVVYTCITDAYDSIPKVDIVNPNVKYVCFVDRQTKRSIDFNVVEPWSIVEILDQELNAKNLNRKVKICPHLYFKNLSNVIYIDGSIDIVGDVLKFIEPINTYVPIALYKHFSRETILAEAEECVRAGFNLSYEFYREYQGYIESGYKDYGLYECNIIYRNFSIDVTQSLCDKWWSLYSVGAGRDQISFPVASWLVNVNPLNLGLSDARTEKKWFSLRHSHSMKGYRLRQRAIRKINQLIGFFS